MSGTDRERKKEYMKNYYYKRKNLFNHLINHVELEIRKLELEIENVCPHL